MCFLLLNEKKKKKKKKNFQCLIFFLNEIQDKYQLEEKYCQIHFTVQIYRYEQWTWTIYILIKKLFFFKFGIDKMIWDMTLWAHISNVTGQFVYIRFKKFVF